MSFEIITEIWTYWLNEMSLENITEGLTYFNQRYDVWEHYRNLNLSHSTRCRLRALQKSEIIALTICRLRALQKSELIALNEMSFESITEIWTDCTQRDIGWDHYRNLNLLTKRDVAWEHYRRFNLFQSTIWRLRALQKSELIALNKMSFESITEIWNYCIDDMSFESITEIWTYCTQRDVVWDHYRNLNLLTKRDVAWEHYRRFNLFQSTIWRLRALQKSELIALNEMSFESITEIWNYCIADMSFESITEIWTYCTQRDVVWEHYRNLNRLHSTRCHLRALQKSELITLNHVSFESITEMWTYCTQRDVAWEHYRNLNLLHSTRCRLRSLQKFELID